MLAGALAAGTTACSTGTSDGDVNVEESDFKDKDPTEHNAPNTTNQPQPTTQEMKEDSTYEAIYDRQEEKSRTRNSGSGIGAAANPTGNAVNKP